MLKEIKSFIYALIKAAPNLHQIYKQHHQEVRILELQESAFLIRDIVNTADDLLSLINNYGDLDFVSLPVDVMKQHYSLVQTKLTVQLQRLQRLREVFISNPSIDLLDSEIKNQFIKALGSKESGLFAVGAGLFFNQIFGSVVKEDESDSDRAIRVIKEKYEFVKIIIDRNKLSLDQQREIVEELKDLQRRYLKVLDQVMDAKDKLMLAQKGAAMAANYGLRQ